MKTQNLKSLLFLYILILINTATTTTIEARTTTTIQNQEKQDQPEKCTSSCGDIHTITYPFRLTTDPPSCGDKDYQLTCLDNKTLVINFNSAYYIVKTISYDTHFIRIVDINLYNGTCNLPYKSVSDIELSTDDRFRGLVVSNTYTSFVRCVGDGVISDDAYRKVPCFSGDGSDVYVSYGTYIISQLQGSCSFISRVPSIYQAVRYPSYDSIVKLMQQGFDLGWSVECRDCVRSGKACSLTSLDQPYIYECASEPGFYLDPLIRYILLFVLQSLLIINLIARFILAPIVIVCFLVHKYRTTKRSIADGKQRSSVLEMQFPVTQMPIRYSYSDIVSITDGFREKLGQGGHGTVYKGQLPDGHLVAVKMLTNSLTFKNEEFNNGIYTISKIRHVNIVPLLGFCSDESHRGLVLEYMPNSSLDKYMLHRETGHHRLNWDKLLRIAIDTARGIEFLHAGLDECILHLDIKPHNVLLDQDFVPKVSDFGIRKLCPQTIDLVSISSVKGTTGYIAPELLSNNIVSVSPKSDVYSFGVLLLEMVSRRTSHSSHIYFSSWVCEKLLEGGDLGLKENASEIDIGTAKKMCAVGLWCIQKKASNRPSMARVLEMLEGKIDDLQLPGGNELSFPVMKEPKSDSPTELLIDETVEQSV